MLSQLCLRVTQAGCSRIVGAYVPSAKNALVGDLYPHLGFAPAGERDGVARWEYDIARSGSIPSDFIRVTEDMRRLAERLSQVFRELFNDQSLVLTDDMTSDDVPGWDSLAHVNLMFSIEEAFGIEFADDEFGEFTNVGELQRTIERKVGERT